MIEDLSKNSRSDIKSITLKRFLYLSLIPIGILILVASLTAYKMSASIQEHTSNLARHTITSVLNAQRGAINLEALRYALITLSETADGNRARDSYINVWKLLSESAAEEHEQTRKSMNELLDSVREVWEARQAYDNGLTLLKQLNLAVYNDLFKAYAMAIPLERMTLPELNFNFTQNGYRHYDPDIARHQLSDLNALNLHACHALKAAPYDQTEVCTRLDKNLNLLDEKIDEQVKLGEVFDAKVETMKKLATVLGTQYASIETSGLINEIRQINRITDPSIPSFILVSAFSAITILILFVWFIFVMKPLMEINAGMRKYLVDAVIPRFALTRIREINDAIAWFTVFCDLHNRSREERKNIEEKYSELMTESTIDPLTGVENRKSLRQFIDDNNAIPANTRVLMVDIDFFKEINDTRGHLFGDRILENLGKQLKLGITENDRIYRFGGEEFCIVMSNTNEDKSRKVAACLLRMARYISRQDSAIHGAFVRNQPLTISIGLSTIAKSARQGSLMELVHEADTALYAAKSKGRDRFCEFGDLTPAEADAHDHGPDTLGD